MDPQQRLLLEVAWEALERRRDRPAVAARQPAPGCSSGSWAQDYGAAAARGSDERRGLRADRDRGAASPRAGSRTCFGSRARR